MGSMNLNQGSVMLYLPLNLFPKTQTCKFQISNQNSRFVSVNEVHIIQLISYNQKEDEKSEIQTSKKIRSLHNSKLKIETKQKNKLT